MEHISLYHKYSEDKENKFLKEKTISDLNLYELFQKIDFTSSSIGRQYLWHLICKGMKSNIEEYEKDIKTLSENKELRDTVSKTLRPLNNNDAYSIIDVIYQEKEKPSQTYLLILNILRWLPLLFVIMLIMSGKGIFIFLILAAYITNGYIHFKKKDEMMDYFFSVPQILNLFKITAILNQNDEINKMFPKLSQAIAETKTLKKNLGKFKIFVSLESDMAMIAYVITEVVNIFFLYSAINIIYSFIYIDKNRKELKELYDIIGILDVLCGISYLRENIQWCYPSAPEDNEMISVKNIYHPIIENCVRNDFHLTNKCALITGSNMSGKTSFIKTIGINLIIAKAINTCFADEFKIDLNREVHSVIDNKDDICDGKSFFMSEVENLKKAIEHGKSGNNLFILDELLKGTNTTERIAINYAILDNLAKNGNIVLTSTHDYKLTALLCERYELYHFCENVIEGELTFDYKIKDGIVKEGNAIKVLQLCNYPEEIVNVAKEIVAL